MAQAIDSALAQTHENVEVIVVDDGSTDGSREIILSYGNRVKPVFKVNGGQASTFNAGFRNSAGKFICYLDADDLLLPQAVESSVRLFEEGNIVKVHWPMFIINGNNEKSGKLIPKDGILDGDRREIVLSEGPFHNWHHNPPTSGNIWADWFLEKILPIPENQFRLGADGYLHTIAPIYGVVRSTDEPLGYYRVHTSNNYFLKKLDDKTVKFYQQRFEDYFVGFQEHFRSQGIEVDPDSWKVKNYNYLWLQRLLDARNDVKSKIPNDSLLTVIDSNELGEQFLPGYDVRPFLELDGQYAGAPINDESAIMEVERQKASGSKYLLLWWTSFWWFEHYREFTTYLDVNYRRILDNERLVAFALADRRQSQ